MKYLITGGCGFLGSNLAAEILRQNEELAVLDNLYRVGSAANLAWLERHGEFRFYHGDIRNPHDVERLVEDFQPEVIFHLAGQVAMTTSLAQPRMDFEVNALGSVNVLEAVREHVPMAVVVYSSTNKVYGDLEYLRYEERATRYVCPELPNGVDESVPLDFHSPYGCSKGAADQYMLDYGRLLGLNTVVFRHSSIYGGRQFATYDQGWVGWFCQKALETKLDPTREPFTISGNGKQVRDVLHVRDAVSCYMGAVKNIEKVRGKAFNIGGGINNSLSLLELFGLLEEMTEVKMVFRQIEPRVSDQKFFVADFTKAQEHLGWKPKVWAKEGITGMLDWLGNLVA
jgi:CDP-paratose 2-epimerase